MAFKLRSPAFAPGGEIPIKRPIVLPIRLAEAAGRRAHAHQSARISPTVVLGRASIFGCVCWTARRSLGRLRARLRACGLRIRPSPARREAGARGSSSWSSMIREMEMTSFLLSLGGGYVSIQGCLRAAIAWRLARRVISARL